MPFSLGWLYRKLGRRYFPLFLVFEYVSGTVITLATVGLFSLYEDMSERELWRVALLSLACVTAAMTYYAARVWRLARPLIEWAGGSQRSPEEAPGAWRRGGRAAAPDGRHQRLVALRNRQRADRRVLHGRL